jgi:hypothetical protein
MPARKTPVGVSCAMTSEEGAVMGYIPDLMEERVKS